MYTVVCVCVIDTVAMCRCIFNHLRFPSLIYLKKISLIDWFCADEELLQLLTDAMRSTVLQAHATDIPFCTQCGRSAKQRLNAFAGTEYLFFCSERCKMRALNGPHRRQLLHSLKSTDPDRWRFLQLSCEPHLVWRSENVKQLRSTTAPPDFARAKAIHRVPGKTNDEVLDLPEMTTTSVIRSLSKRRLHNPNTKRHASSARSSPAMPLLVNTGKSGRDTRASPRTRARTTTPHRATRS
eukprot:m.154324 g.154324  ORF g.154324 m.154324 type:complete len:239 (+) comp14298_c0_seq16:2656-3372(+)